MYANKDVVELLIARGADVNARTTVDKDTCRVTPTQGSGKAPAGRTPLSVAGTEEIASIIRRHGGVE